MQRFFEVTQVPRVAVGYRSFEKMPHEFIRVEFGRISWEPVGMQPRVFSKELPDHRSFVVVAVVLQ
jgi:hypothetical protein